MANDIFNYCVATNTGKGFITHDDSRRFWISGYPANVWVATDCVESRHWIARNNGTSKTKAEAQTLVTNNVNAAKQLGMIIMKMENLQQKKLQDLVISLQT